MTRQPAPTSDKLRDAIDRGNAADKVDYPDPAAAPLGTDDEAGGTSPSAAERSEAYNDEVRAREAGDQGFTEDVREAESERRGTSATAFWVMAAIAVAVVAVVIAVYL